MRLLRRANLRRSPTLIFLHIPKCAGTSFRSLVEAEYRSRELLYSYNGELDFSQPNEEFLREFRRRRDDIRIVFGHLSFGVHEILGIAPHYATIVRDPIDRVISQYRHIMRDPSSPWHSVAKRVTSIQEFVAGRFTEMTNNHMVRILAGPPVASGFVGADPEMLDRAKSNIMRHFVIVGLRETMPGVVNEFSRRFSWRNFATPSHNVAPPSSPIELDEGTGRLIVDHNRLDIALYEWIKAKEYGQPRTVKDGERRDLAVGRA